MKNIVLLCSYSIIANSSMNLVVQIVGMLGCEGRAQKLYWSRKIETQTEIEKILNPFFHPFYFSFI